MLWELKSWIFRETHFKLEIRLHAEIRKPLWLVHSCMKLASRRQKVPPCLFGKRTGSCGWANFKVYEMLRYKNTAFYIGICMCCPAFWLLPGVAGRKPPFTYVADTGMGARVTKKLWQRRLKLSINCLMMKRTKSRERPITHWTFVSLDWVRTACSRIKSSSAGCESFCLRLPTQPRIKSLSEEVRRMEWSNNFVRLPGRHRHRSCAMEFVILEVESQSEDRDRSLKGGFRRPRKFH